MNQDVCVKRNKKHRILLRLLTICHSIATIILVVASKQITTEQAWILIAVLCVGINLSAFSILCYFETWTLIVTQSGIKRKCFLSNAAFSYSQIKCITLSYSYTERYIVNIRIVNGQTLRFRFEDENANKAVTKLKRHTSIQSIPQ